MLEGAQHQWITPSLEQADLIILLDVPFAQRVKQIKQRFKNQLAGIELAPYQLTAELLTQMLQWNQAYEDFQRVDILKLLKPISNKNAHPSNTNGSHEF